VPEHFYLDSAAVRQRAGDNRTSSEALDAAFRNLTTVLDDHDGCWGTDDIGKNFAEGYVDSANETRGYAGDAVEGLDGWSTGVESAVEGLTNLDADNAEAVDHEIANQLENPPPES
jgi:hypothetical protein